MEKVKIILVTTSRADYGILYPLIRKLTKDSYFEVKLIASGSHLSELHGKTIDNILNDGTNIDYKIDISEEGDSEKDVCNSIAKGIIGFGEAIFSEKPDLIIILGDRYELWPIAITSIINKIPIAHIHGGEATFGAIDDVVRNSITKMSTIHFPTIEQYAKRIIQMGEKPEMVFAVGSLGIDNVFDIPLMDRDELSEFTGIDFRKNIALMTYHPVTFDEYHQASKQAIEVLNAFLDKDLLVLATMPNMDAGGNSIYLEIKKFKEKYPDKIYLIKSLGQRAYLSTMKYARLMVGNSSSGIIESASFKLPVVNIGDRQSGRMKPGNVIDCICEKASVSNAIDYALSDEFGGMISKMENPYGDGHASERIINILKSIDFSDKFKLLKKGFYDIDYGIN